MTNFDKWQEYTKGIPAPQNFIDWGYYYLIATCLQRRVWCFSDEDKCYANMYVCLVGPPGTGKGLVTKRLIEILRYWKQEVALQHKNGQSTLSESESKMADALAQSDLKAAEDVELNGKKSGLEKPNLYPVAADAVTYEALVQSMAQCYRRVTYTEFDKTIGKDVMRVQGHSSLCFVLDEISSLFRKRTEDVSNFLLTAYGCGEDYTYKTKTQGTDRIRRLCLNFIGGTTPDFMQSTFDDQLIGNGYSSRTFFIYATKPRFAVFRMAELTAEQVQYKKDIIDHILKLYFLFGECRVDKETEDFMLEYMKQDLEHPEKRINKSTKMVPYYARKNIHITKLAMALHFGDSTDMHIPLSRFKQAIEILDKEERTMHLALTLDGDNPLAKPSRKILEHLQRVGKDTFTSILADFYGHLRKSELEEVLEALQQTEQITTQQITDEVTGHNVLWYMIKQH